MLKIVLNNTANYRRTDNRIGVPPPLPSKKSIDSWARTLLPNLRIINIPRANLMFVVDVVFGLSSRFFAPVTYPTWFYLKKIELFIFKPRNELEKRADGMCLRPADEVIDNSAVRI